MTQVSKDNPLAITASVSYQALGGARLHSIAYDFGDQTAPVSPAAGQQSASHVYAQAGNYNVTATLTFIDTDSQPIAAVTCQAPVTVTMPPTPPPVTPVTPTPPAPPEPPVVNTVTSTEAVPVLTQPTALVNAGPNILGILSAFASATIAGMLGYRLLLQRRMS